MSVSKSLTAVVATVNAYTGSWDNAQLAIDVDFVLWEIYDPDMAFVYPNVRHWDDLLQETIDNDSYNELAQDQVLSILFGLHHRNRVNDGLWFRMFSEGVTQRLLERLLAMDADKH